MDDGDGVQSIDDDPVRAALRRQARRVHLQSVVTVLVVEGLLLLIPGAPIAAYALNASA